MAEERAVLARARLKERIDARKRGLGLCILELDEALANRLAHFLVVVAELRKEACTYISSAPCRKLVLQRAQRTREELLCMRLLKRAARLARETRLGMLRDKLQQTPCTARVAVLENVLDAHLP